MTTTTKTKTRPTLKYRAKVLPSNWGLSSEMKVMLKIQPHIALSCFLGGEEVDEYHWNALAFRVHVGASLADLAVPDVTPQFTQAIAVLDKSLSRFQTVGRYDFTAKDLAVIGDALNFADNLQDISTRAEQRARGIELVRANYNCLSRIGLVSKEAARKWIS